MKNIMERLKEWRSTVPGIIIGIYGIASLMGFKISMTPEAMAEYLTRISNSLESIIPMIVGIYLILSGKKPENK